MISSSSVKPNFLKVDMTISMLATPRIVLTFSFVLFSVDVYVYVSVSVSVSVSSL